MLRRSLLAAGLLASLLAGATSAAGAQLAQRPESPPASRPYPPPRPAPPPAAPANICTTQWGWCQLPTWSAPPGIGCGCLTADNREVPGTTRYFPYSGPASPYLQPHSGPPSTIR
ncbi:MAG: hypothetical protein ACRELZ_25980 [Candidatus Rokuibacteriota bacterium]